MTLWSVGKPRLDTLNQSSVIAPSALWSVGKPRLDTLHITDDACTK